MLVLFNFLTLCQNLLFNFDSCNWKMFFFTGCQDIGTHYVEVLKLNSYLHISENHNSWKKGYTKLYRKIPWDLYRGMKLPQENTGYCGKKTDSRYYFTPCPKNPRKFNGIFVNILFKKKVTVTKGDNKRRKKLPTESKEDQK